MQNTMNGGDTVTPLMSAYFTLPDGWDNLPDEQRLDYIRARLREIPPDPPLRVQLEMRDALRAERHRLQERIAYRARQASVPGMARARLFEAQGGLCAVCAAELGYDSANLDHDHACCEGPPSRACGQCFRGLLCNACNTALGLFMDSPDRLRAAAAYLETAGV